MDERELARLLALARAATGAMCFVAPRRSARLWFRAEGDPATTVPSLRGLGIRDVALGVGILRALENDGPVRTWLEAGVIADVGDALAALAGWRRLPKLNAIGTLLIAGGAAVLGSRLAAEVD